MAHLEINLSTEELQQQQAMKSLLRTEISRAGGFLPFDRYMELALYAPDLGYYAAGAQKLGRGGDFVTAPELSPLYGHCLAAQVAQVLVELKGGEILEFGPGSGALAIQILSELKRLNALPKRYLLLETSANLRQRQQEKLTRELGELADLVVWLDCLPQKPWHGVVLANEVLDAMPVHRFRMVQSPNSVQEGGVEWRDDAPILTWRAVQSLDLAQQVADLQTKYDTFEPDYQSEINMRAQPWLRAISEFLSAGLVLLIDYGYTGADFYRPDRSMGTLICHYRHTVNDDPLALPGLQDITSNVDFSALAQAATRLDLTVSGFTTQAHFLLASGFDQQAAKLVEAGDFEQIQALQQAKLLVLPSEMGERFKFLALTRALEDLVLTGFSFRDLAERL